MSFYHIGKVKRTRKTRGRNTQQCPGLTGLQPGEYRRGAKGATMAELDELADEPSFNLLESFGLFLATNN